MAVTDVTANRLRSSAAAAASSSSSAPAFLNLLPFLTLTESCDAGHLLHYHILGESGEGEREEEGSWRWGEGDGGAVWPSSDKGSPVRTTAGHLAPHICKLT